MNEVIKITRWVLNYVTSSSMCNKNVKCVEMCWKLIFKREQIENKNKNSTDMVFHVCKYLGMLVLILYLVKYLL